MAKRHELSPQEADWVNQLIVDICEEEHVNADDDQYRMVGWTAFLECYRKNNGYLGDSFWNRTIEAMENAIHAEKANLSNQRFRELSLNHSIRDDTEETFLDFLPSKVGDCSNRVAFFDFLSRLPKELGQLSNSILQGYSPSEICAYYHWSAEEFLSHREHLRQALQEYLDIE